MTDLSSVFTGIRFENPILLASAPTDRVRQQHHAAYEPGWGGVVTKTIGLHPVSNVRGPGRPSCAWTTAGRGCR